MYGRGAHPRKMVRCNYRRFSPCNFLYNYSVHANGYLLIHINIQGAQRLPENSGRGKGTPGAPMKAGLVRALINAIMPVILSHIAIPTLAVYISALVVVGANGFV